MIRYLGDCVRLLEQQQVLPCRRYDPAAHTVTRIERFGKKRMNSELVKKALEIVLEPHVLVNLISRRVRQLNSGNGGMCRPLILSTENMGDADIALREIIEGKMSFEMPEMEKLIRPSARKRRVPQGWAKHQLKHDERAPREDVDGASATNSHVLLHS